MELPRDPSRAAPTTCIRMLLDSSTAEAPSQEEQMPPPLSAEPKMADEDVRRPDAVQMAPKIPEAFETSAIRTLLGLNETSAANASLAT